MFSKTLTFVLSLATAVTAYPRAALAERDTDTKIYAYGSGISGLTVFGGSDGKAYITSNTTTNSSLSELHWTTPNTDAPWNVTLTEKWDGTSVPANFYIVTSADAYEECGFTSRNRTAPAGSTTTGFTKFGQSIIWSTGSEYISLFWAENTDVDGLYKLKWNVAGDKKDDSVSVTLKTTAPS